MEYVVYADVLWLVNFMLDFMLLWCTGRFGNCCRSRWRLLLAAVLGGGYGIGLLWPQLALLYWLPVKLLFPVAMLALAFAPLAWQRLLKLLAYFYLAAFAMAGAVVGGGSLLNQTALFDGGVQSIHIVTLLFAVLLAGLLANYSWRALSKHWQRESQLASVKIQLDGREVCIGCLLDTGNALAEPGGRPVLVAEYQAVRDLLPKALGFAFENYGGGRQGAIRVLNRFTLKEEALAQQLHLSLIPFRALGQEDGMLLGWRPAATWLRQPGSQTWQQTEALTVGLYHHRLGGSKGYRAIINPAVAAAKLEIQTNRNIDGAEKGAETWKIGA